MPCPQKPGEGVILYFDSSSPIPYYLNTPICQNLNTHYLPFPMFAKISKMELKQLIGEAWNNREFLKEKKYTDAIREVIEEVDKGRLRVAELKDMSWQVNEWVKQAILLYFAIQPMQTWSLSPFEFHDK